MNQPVILDASPLVAFLKKEDDYHQWSNATMRALEGPLFTCEPVIVEACFLLRRTYAGQESVMSLISDGIIQVDFSLADHATALRTLMAQYDSVPMSLADACLVRMAELRRNSVVMTFDSDFKIYRMNRNEIIPLMTPDDR